MPKFIGELMRGFDPHNGTECGDHRSNNKPGFLKDLWRIAKRNRVLRDAWGSFYYHPHLLETKAGRQDLERLLLGLKGLGYQFVDLESFIQGTP